MLFTSPALAAAAAIFGYAVIIGFTDNKVGEISGHINLWQFHAMRTAMVLGLVVLAWPLLRRHLAVRDGRALAARSAVHGLAMLCYFGALGFVSVTEAVGGLFTAPLFVLLIEGLVFRAPIGPRQMFAVAAGFVGVVILLRLDQGVELRPVLALPVIAGALYALGNIATRRWCAQENAISLTLGFFGALGLFGLLGTAVTFVTVPAVPDFLTRPPAWPSGAVSFWVFVQAAGSLVGVALMVRAYQLADAAQVAVFEYVLLPVAALWGWLLHATVPDGRQWLGIALVVASGLLALTRSERRLPA